MARPKCGCGNQILWKADEPQSDEWLLAALPDLTDPSCARLWVFWNEDDTPAEYVPADSDVRPVRKKLPA